MQPPTHEDDTARPTMPISGSGHTVAGDPGPPAARWNNWDMAKAIGVVIIGTLVAGLIAAVIADSLLDEGQEYEDDATALTIVLLPSMVVVELLLLGTALWFGPRKYRLPLAALGLKAPTRGAWWLAGAMGLAGLALVYGYDGVVSLLGGEPESTADEVFDNVGPFLVVAIAAVFMAPIIEEIFFRGFIFGSLWRSRGWVLGAVVSGLLFAGAHLSLYGLPVFLAIGLLFAWSYRYTGSIRSSMIAHAIINVVTVGVGLATSG